MAFQSARTATNRRLTTSEVRNLSRSEVAQIHQDNIRKSLEHRIRIAKEQGNQALIRILEVEQRQLA